MANSAVKKWAFYGIALSLPLLLLAGAEFTLRLMNYGQQYPLFMPSQLNSQYLQTNPAIIKRYFPAGQAPAISPDTVLFKAKKPANSLRIVIQGESSAAGFPYGRWGSLQGMLEQRFKREYPDKTIEIINTAMAGVTSYTLLDLADDIVAIQPDLVLIYAGHNEYLGVFGVGSAITASGNGLLTRVLLKLKRLRLYQLVEHSLFVEQDASAQSHEQQQTLMAKVAAGQHIKLDSPMYHKGIKQYRRNLTLLLNHYQRYKIPVLLGDLVSNERDLPPFSAVNLLDWAELKRRIDNSSLSGPELSQIQQVLQQDEAGQAYLQALLASQQGELAAAQRDFMRARDADTLRFRAPSAFNQVVAELAAQSGVSLVAVEQAFRQASEAQLIGNHLLLEHVHPNVDGYFLLAEQFYQAIVATGLAGSPQQQQLSNSAARQDVLLSEVDIGYAELKIANLVNQYPFVARPVAVTPYRACGFIPSLILKRVQGEDWLLVQQQLLNHYRQQGEWLRAAQVAASLADALPYHHAILSVAANLYFQAEDLVLAAYYFTRALNLAPDNMSDRMNLAHVHFLQADYQASLRLLLEAQLAQPHYPQLQQFIDRVQQAMSAKSD